MELLWQNGSVVMHNQSHRESKKPPLPVTNTGHQVNPDQREIRSSDAENYNTNQHLFIQEDEMAAWLFDSINEDPPINTETLFHPSTSVIIQGYVVQPQPDLLLQQPTPSASRPPPPIHRTRKEDQMRNNKPNNFANHDVSMEASMTSSSMIPARRETTMVDSCDTPMMTTEKTYSSTKLSKTIRSTAYTNSVSVSVSTTEKTATSTGCGGTVNADRKVATTNGVKENMMLDITMTSSHNCSTGSGDSIQRKLELEGKRKSKSRVSNKPEFQSQVSKILLRVSRLFLSGK